MNKNCLVILLCLHTSWQCSQNTNSWQYLWYHTHGFCSYDHFTMPTISVSLTQVTIECQMEQLKNNMNCSHQEQQYPIWVLFSLAKIDMSLYQQYICGRNIWTYVIVLYTWTVIVEHLIQPFSLGQPINQVVPAFLLVLDSSFCLQC